MVAQNRGAISGPPNEPVVETNIERRTISGAVVGLHATLWTALSSGLGSMQFLQYHYHTFDLGIFAQGT